ncbi:isoprenoid biosynthesis glyoxalase ElbB [Dongshaea marina]|uniref:isoprenoid biosynthesis glyoxalase ElbB n=1 Tax=Dongshaea marina TaxID=2047966 RepID=UPI000D3E344F|nr:isoprenoid biosynthesis glyoxalase ElbB [Dongshaea marina]
MKKIAVILSGCGVFDGSEIHESVISLLAIRRQGASYQCFAPNVPQYHVIDHLTGDEQSERRNVLKEAARIARGEIQDLKQLDPSEFDALLIPGGFGAAKNLCDFAIQGPEFQLNPQLQRVASAFAKAKKPAGYLCIAPVMIPHFYGPGVELTIGKDPQTAAAITALGGKHIECAVDDYVYDEQHRVLSTPAYMLAGSIEEAADGIEKLVAKLVEIA